jgi:hypothetical protein
MKVQGPKLAHTMHIHHNMAQDNKSKVGGVHKQLNDMLYYDKVEAFFSLLFGNKLKYLTLSIS